MGAVTCRAGARGLYLYWDELPPHSRKSMPALKVARRGARWAVTGVRIRLDRDSIVEVETFVFEPGLPLAFLLPREPGEIFGSGTDPVGPEWDAISAWLESMGFVFDSVDDVEEIVREVPIRLLAPFSRAIKEQRRAGRSLTAFDRHRLLWSLSPGWEWLHPSAPSSAHRISTLAQKLGIPLRAARRLATILLFSGLDSAPTPNEAALFALGLHFAPLDRRLGHGGPFAGLARSFAIQWRKAGSEPLLLWIRALQVARTKRWSYLFRDLPILDEELLSWLRSLQGLVQEREMDPSRSMAVVAGWISESDLEQVRDSLLEAEVNPITPTDDYAAATPITSPIRVAALTAVPIRTGEALRDHPCVGHFCHPNAQIRCLLEGDAWYFDFIADSGPRVLAVFRERDRFEALMLVAEDRLVTNLEPWSPLIDAIRPVLDANPYERGSPAYRALLEDRLPVPLPRAESLETQLAWAVQQAHRLGAFEFMTTALRFRMRWEE